MIWWWFSDASFFYSIHHNTEKEENQTLSLRGQMCGWSCFYRWILLVIVLPFELHVWGWLWNSFYVKICVWSTSTPPSTIKCWCVFVKSLSILHLYVKYVRLKWLSVWYAFFKCIYFIEKSLVITWFCALTNVMKRKCSFSGRKCVNYLVCIQNLI